MVPPPMSLPQILSIPNSCNTDELDVTPDNTVPASPSASQPTTAIVRVKSMKIKWLSAKTQGWRSPQRQGTQNSNGGSNSDLFGGSWLRAHRGHEPVYGQSWVQDPRAENADAAPVPAPRRSSLTSKQISGTVLLIQHLKSDDGEPTVLRSSTVLCHWFLQLNSLQVFMMLLTVAVLFCGDIFAATLPVSSDKGYSVILWVCLVCFSSEWVLNVISSPAQTPSYNCSLFFWLDIIATLSILLDILVLEANNLVNNGPIARAARAARLGTRAGRSMRLLRLLRFLRLVRIVRVIKALLKIRDKSGSKRDPAADAIDQQLQSGNTSRADAMGARIGAMTTRKVIIMTLGLLIVLPLMERNDQEQTCAAELVMLLLAIWNSPNVAGNCTAMRAEVAPWLTTGLIPFSRAPNSGLTANGLIYMQVQDCMLYKFEALMGNVDLAQSSLASLRRGSEVQVIPCDATFSDTENDGVDSRSSTYLLYDMWMEEKESARLAIGFTVVVIVTLLGFSMIFSQDAEILASELVVPIGQLMQDMRKTSQLELDDVTPEEDMFDSEVYEVKRLQLAYRSLNGAVESFVKFMPVEVVRHFLSAGSEATLGVQQRNVSIFFSDIVDFGHICDAHPPKEVLALLAEYFECMATIICEEQGTMLEFIGDTIMAIWNAPNTVEEHTVRAISGALRMNVELVKLRAKWEQEGKPQIRQRVGLHAADVFVGNLGSRMRMKYGVLGDGVNLASRVEQLNLRYSTEIVISEDAYVQDGVKDTFYTRPLDYVVVKGRKNPTMIYEVLDCKIFASETTKSIAEQACQAWESYKSRDFTQALQCLDNITELKGLTDDPVGEVLHNRCQKFLLFPPGPDWDGSEVLLQKSFGMDGH